MTYIEKLKDPRWQKRRLEIFDRDGFMCQFCRSTTSTLCVHHIIYVGDPWETPDECLITLCEDCHRTEEALKLFDLYEVVKSCRLTRLDIHLLLQQVAFYMRRYEHESPMKAFNAILVATVKQDDRDALWDFLHTGRIETIKLEGLPIGEEVN